MSEVKTRFAPSPTGSLHIGGVRTALYSYLVAKAAKGKFFLRIEDTDRTRFVEGATEDIIDTLKWLGLDFEKEIIYQSERKEIYQKYAAELVEKGLAYKQDGAVWFKVNPVGVTKITDLVGNREIEIDNGVNGDFVILKSDGYPTYHLAHVVDDHEMQTNPVIRAAEWISSIPRHVMLFKAFGWETPSYAHIPIILGPDKSKLSKRHGAKAASEFRQDGFLPKAILNYMALLGWTPKDSEILSMDEMIQQFDLKDVHVVNPVFDIVKLEWMNGEYIRRMSDEELLAALIDYLNFISKGELKNTKYEDTEKLRKIAPLIKERIKKLSEFVPMTDFLFDSPEYDKEKLASTEELNKILETLENMKKPWDSKVFEETFRKLAEEMKISASKMFQLIRMAISGQTVTPPLFESIQILGEDETIDRVNQALKFISQN